MINNHTLQFITHYNKDYSYIGSARIALEGGCKWIQLRMKDVNDTIFEETAIIIQKMCRDYGATFIINDNVFLAKKINADGVHLGKNDMSLLEARKILGDKFIIGITVNTFEDILLNIEKSSPNYLGCGPFRFTSTKKNLSPVLGIDGYKKIISEMNKMDINIPLIAIGGICKDDISELLKCGVDGIALSSSVINAKNPQLEMKQIKQLF